MSLVRSYNRSACLLCVLGITTYFTATVYTDQPAMLIGLCGLPAVVAAWWLSSRHKLLLPRWAVNGLLLLAVAYAASHALRRVTVEVIADLVVLIQVIKLGDRRSPRDDAQVLSLAVFLAIAAMLTSPQFWVGLQLLAFIPLLVATVMLYQLYSGWFAAAPGPAFAAQTLSAPVRLRGSVALASAGTLALALFVFVIMPRGVGENVFGNWPGQQGGTRTAFTDHVKLGSADVISDSPRIALDMMVRDTNMNDDEPGANMGSPDLVLYLRGAVLDVYEPINGVWKPARGAPKHHNPQAEGGVIQLETHAHPNVRQDITIHGIDRSMSTLFCLWRPSRVLVGPTSNGLDEDADTGTIRRSGRSGLFDYTVLSELNEPVGQTPAARTPASYPSAPVHDLAVRVLKAAGVEADPAARPIDEDATAARAIQDFLRKEYGYTLVETATPAGRDPIEYFLLDSREGHCEYFAGAMVLMCRSVGINARMAAGYVAAEFNESSGRYVVRESNAHAWVEVEAAGRWRTYDPTPPSDLARLHKPQAGLLASLRRAMESVEYAWNTGVVGFDEGSRQRILGPPEGRRAGVLGAFDSITSRLQSAGPRAVLAALVVGIAVFLAVAGLGLGLSWTADRLRPLLRRRAHAGIPAQSSLSPERRSQVRFYARLLDELRARGLGKPAWRPPLAHAAAIRGNDPAAAGATTELVGLYYAATFGDRALSAPEVARAEQALARLSGPNA